MSVVTVAVATFRRPERLDALIPRLFAQFDTAVAWRPELSLGLVIIDNDPDESARETVARHVDGRVRYTTEAAPGVTAVRNRALDESAGSDLLVFIDDDESPDERWLVALIETRERFTATAVAGPVVAAPDGPVDPWVVASESHLRTHRAGLVTGDAVDRAATNNLLLDRAWVERHGLRFDERFGLTGGEDSLFTRRLVRLGGRIVWCTEAVVHDHIPADRMSRSYNLRRVFSLSNAGARVDLALADSFGERLVVRSKLALSGVARIVIGVARATRGRLRGSLRDRAFGERFAMRGRGELAAVVGYAASPYRRG
ncbi:glycosyltransferase [Agromyces atrinae]|uniref:glycosyltransferase family 2 protein n=1 Tax=Agromyces atrinae TaxID=592376 RepID=UPI001F56E30D|nr:glycosyltransferase [Agromyces atrinae]MCI2956178.1 glycosyltransferase [Agromyces atrinae]